MPTRFDVGRRSLLRHRYLLLVSAFSGITCIQVCVINVDWNASRTQAPQVRTAAPVNKLLCTARNLCCFWRELSSASWLIGIPCFHRSRVFHRDRSLALTSHTSHRCQSIVVINCGQGIRGGFKSFLTVVSSSIIVQTPC